MSTGSSYEHSLVFASLKSIKESIATNLTSPQYLQILDTAIHKALLPVLMETQEIEGLISNLVAWQEYNRKRKASHLDRTEFIPLAIAWLLLPTKQEKAAQFYRMKIDRAALLDVVRHFLDDTVSYVQACEAELVVDGVPASIPQMIIFKEDVERSHGTTRSLLPAIKEARHWLQIADKFKEAILEKYVRLCLQHAQKDYATFFNMEIKLDDIVNHYILAASRAIDKCDQRQGVVTTHIEAYFKTARSHLQKQREAPGSHGRENNEQEELESVETEDTGDQPDHTLEAMQLAAHVREVATLIDPEGYGRAFLGILGE